MPFLHEVAERLAGMSERGDGQVFRICRGAAAQVLRRARPHTRTTSQVRVGLIRERELQRHFVRRRYKEHASNEACANENYSKKADGVASNEAPRENLQLYARRNC